MKENKATLLLKYLVLKFKHKKLSKNYENLSKDFNYLFEENKILKTINKKRYVEQSKRMQFLIRRENKLQMIEQLANAPKRDTRKIMKLIMEEL